MLAHRTLLQPVSFGELTHRLTVSSRAQAQHQFLPHRFAQRFAAMEHFVAAQTNFFVVLTPHPGPFDGHLLAHHHAITALLAPTAGGPLGLWLTAFTSQLANFFFHH